MTQSPTEYLINRYKRLYTPFIVNGEGRFYECKGEMIPEKEFLKQFPVAETIRVLHAGQHKGDNIGSAAL